MFGGYRKFRRVSEMYQRHQKIKNLALGFNGVSKIARGYRKRLGEYQKYRKVSDIARGYRKC